MAMSGFARSLSSKHRPQSCFTRLRQSFLLPVRCSSRAGSSVIIGDQRDYLNFLDAEQPTRSQVRFVSFDLCAMGACVNRQSCRPEQKTPRSLILHIVLWNPSIPNPQRSNFSLHYINHLCSPSHALQQSSGSSACPNLSSVLYGVSATSVSHPDFPRTES